MPAAQCQRRNVSVWPGAAVYSECRSRVSRFAGRARRPMPTSGNGRCHNAERAPGLAVDADWWRRSNLIGRRQSCGGRCHNACALGLAAARCRGRWGSGSRPSGVCHVGRGCQGSREGWPGFAWHCSGLACHAARRIVRPLAGSQRNSSPEFAAASRQYGQGKFTDPAATTCLAIKRAIGVVAAGKQRVSWERIKTNLSLGDGPG